MTSQQEQELREKLAKIQREDILELLRDTGWILVMAAVFTYPIAYLFHLLDPEKPFLAAIGMGIFGAGALSFAIFMISQLVRSLRVKELRPKGAPQ